MYAEGESIGFLLKRIHDNLDRQANNRLKPCGMTFSQMRLLIYLYLREGETPSQKDIGEHLQVTHPTVVGLLKRLEAKGLVRCGFDSADRRIKSVYLTEEGKGYIRDAHMHRARMEARITRGLSPEETERLRELLRKVLENVSEK